MVKNRKLTFLFGLCMILLIAAVLSVNVSAKYTTTGGGSATAYAAKWGATVDGEVVEAGEEGAKVFDYYKITAKPNGAEVASRIAIKIEDLPSGVTPKLFKAGDSDTEIPDFAKDKKDGLYRSAAETFAPGSTDGVVYKLYLTGILEEEKQVKITPQIEQVN